MTPLPTSRISPSFNVPAGMTKPLSVILISCIILSYSLLPLHAQDTVDWFKFPSQEYPYPEGIKGFQLIMQPLSVPVDMEVQKKFKAASGNWITGTVFPAFFSRTGLQQEVFTVYNVNPSDTFFVRFFTPQTDSCGEYKFRVNTTTIYFRKAKKVMRYFRKVREKQTW